MLFNSTGTFHLRVSYHIIIIFVCMYLILFTYFWQQAQDMLSFGVRRQRERDAVTISNGDYTRHHVQEYYWGGGGHPIVTDKAVMSLKGG